MWIFKELLKGKRAWMAWALYIADVPSFPYLYTGDDLDGSG